MPYAQLDDRYDDHRKVKRAWRLHPAAVGLHAMAITYCSRHNTDGLVHADWIAEKLELSPLRPKERTVVIDVLLEVGLFERNGDEYTVHDYLEWNRSRAEREELAQRGRRGGLAKALAAAKPPLSRGSSEGSSTSLHDTTQAQARQENTVEPSSTASDCFDYWREKCGHPQAKLTTDRRRKIEARLREGYTADDIRKAIDGAARAAFTSDDGKRFDDIELICRNGSKLESFIGRADVAVIQPARSPALEHMDRWKRYYPDEETA